MSSSQSSATPNPPKSVDRWFSHLAVLTSFALAAALALMLLLVARGNQTTALALVQHAELFPTLMGLVVAAAPQFIVAALGLVAGGWSGLLTRTRVILWIGLSAVSVSVVPVTVGLLVLTAAAVSSLLLAWRRNWGHYPTSNRAVAIGIITAGFWFPLIAQSATWLPWERVEVQLVKEGATSTTVPGQPSTSRPPSSPSVETEVKVGAVLREDDEQYVWVFERSTRQVMRIGPVVQREICVESSIYSRKSLLFDWPPEFSTQYVACDGSRHPTALDAGIGWFRQFGIGLLVGLGLLASVCGADRYLRF